MEGRVAGSMNKTMDRIRETRDSFEGANAPDQPKYRLIYEALKEGIISGEYAPGDRLPSETDLVRRFGVSRMTIVKAIKELQSLDLVDRRVGSGTYVKAPAAGASRHFGLLIPELGQTEIFEPICRGMASYPLASRHSLLWGNSVGIGEPKEKVALDLCQHYIAQQVSGVFFAPLELLPVKDEVNRKITAALDRAKIPVVLLDRCFLPYPARSKYDLVGIDNRRTAYGAAEHLVQAGARRIAFLGKRFSAATVDARIAGYREALLAHGFPRGEDLVFRCDPNDDQVIRGILDKHRPDAFLCANDLTAANLMQTLLRLGVAIPNEIRIVGIDDVKYAGLLPIPLTTQHQPCLDIGRVAMATMLDRLGNPDVATRDILLSCRLVVRRSCGSESAASPVESAATK
jgi:GntR family transcriptional regulator, arabinose operon transcriptional repressor